MFEVKKKVEKVEVKKETGPPKKKFLDGKRSQAVSICLAKLPSPEQVQKSLSEMDEKIMNNNQVSSLFSILITKEELNSANSMMNVVGEFDKPEHYILEINKIANVETKLKVWSLINEFNDLCPEISESLEYLEGACTEIKTNKYFKEILATILGLGNILNAGTSKGQADGFSLDLLSKLPGIKDSLGHSMLTWICAKTNKDDPSFEGMKGQFPKLEKAVNFSLNEANNNVNKLKGISNQIKKGIENLDVSDTFKQKSSEQSERNKKSR